MRLSLTREQKVADRYLRSYTIIPDRLESHLAALERGAVMRDSIGSTANAIGHGSGVGDKIAAALAAVEDAEDRILKAARTFGAQMIDVEAFVSEVQRRDRMAGKAIRLVYINGMSADEIADDGRLGCSRKTVYELVRRGLDIAFALLSR